MKAEKFKRFGSVYSGLPWCVEVENDDGTHGTVITRFGTEEEADEYLESVRKEGDDVSREG